MQKLALRLEFSESLKIAFVVRQLFRQAKKKHFPPHEELTELIAELQ
jgi:hypothetical protein